MIGNVPNVMVYPTDVLVVGLEQEIKERGLAIYLTLWFTRQMYWW
jgi:hypothetical protein